MQFFNRSNLCILAAWCLFCLDVTAQAPQASKETSSKSPKASFSRNLPLPKWVQPLAEIPTTLRDAPVVTRLAETQIQLGKETSVLYNRAIQVNERSALAKIGQFVIDYYPLYQKLNLHRVMIIRAGQILDRNSSVNIRHLQRETSIESSMYGGGYNGAVVAR